MSALLNADPEFQKGNPETLAGPMSCAASHGQSAILGLLAGFYPALLNQALATLDPDAAALQLLQWLRTPGDADWTAPLAVRLTDFVASEKNREAFRRAGGLADLVGLLAAGPEFLPSLAHLRAQSAVRQELVAHGAVKALVHLVTNARDSDVACAGLEALWPLAAIDDNLTPDQVAPLWARVPALLRASEMSREAMLNLLQCLSQKKDIAEPMARAGAADWTLPLLVSDEPITQARALAVLHRLAKMLSDVSGSCERLVTLLTAQDSAVRTGAVRAMAELELEGKLQLDATQARQMFEAVGELDKEHRMAALNALSAVLRREKEMQAFVGTDAFYGQLIACVDSGNDTLMQRVAAETLRNLAAKSEEKERIGKVPGVVEVFLKALKNGDHRLVYPVLACMVNLAVLNANKILFGDASELLAVVVSAVGNPRIDVGKAAAALVRNLSVRAANSVFLGVEGAVDAISARARELPSQHRVGFISALGNLAVEPSNATKMIQDSPVMRMLTQSLDSTDMILAHQAARTLQNLSLSVEGKRAIMNAGGMVPAVQATLQRGSVPLCFQAVATLANLAVHKDVKKRIIDAFVAAVVPASGYEAVAPPPVAETTVPCEDPPPGIRRLLELIVGPNDDVASAALVLICKVSVNPDLQAPLAAWGFVPVLAAKLTNPHEPSCMAAAAALGNIAVNETIRNAIGDEVLYKLIVLLSHRSPNVHTSAARALTVFARDFRRLKILERAGAVPRIIKLVPDCRLGF